MKKKRYAVINDVNRELNLNIENILSLKNEVEALELRQSYLIAVADYLRGNCIRPYLEEDILFDDFELEKFALPLILRDKVQILENKISSIESSLRGGKK